MVGCYSDQGDCANLLNSAAKKIDKIYILCYVSSTLTRPPMSEKKDTLGFSITPTWKQALFLSVILSSGGLYLQNVDEKQGSQTEVEAKTPTSVRIRGKVQRLINKESPFFRRNNLLNLEDETYKAPLPLMDDSVNRTLSNFNDLHDQAPDDEHLKIEELNPFTDFDLILKQVSPQMLYQELDQALISISDPETADKIRNAYEEAFEDLTEYLSQIDNEEATCNFVGSETMQHLLTLPEPGKKIFHQMRLFKLLQQAITQKIASQPMPEC